MSSDEIEPIAPVGVDPVRAVSRTDPPRPPQQVAPSLSTGATPHAPELGDAAEHAQLDHPINIARGVDTRASVHDAAVHGNPIAAAIERAHSADPTDRAQQLAGAAASAGSGQAAGEPETIAAPEREDEFDPLGPVDAIDEDPHRRDPRSAEEQTRDDER